MRCHDYRLRRAELIQCRNMHVFLGHEFSVCTRQIVLSMIDYRADYTWQNQVVLLYGHEKSIG